jgi:hypothetical protein
MRTDHVHAGRCWLHSGRTPNGRIQAQREIAERAAAKLGIPRGNGDPFVLLTKAVQHAEGYLEATAKVLADVADPDPKAAAKSQIALGAAAELYAEAIRAASRTGKAAVDADVADRRAALDERAADLLMRFVRELLDRVVPAPQRPALEAWAATRFAELAAEYE